MPVPGLRRAFTTPFAMAGEYPWLSMKAVAEALWVSAGLSVVALRRNNEHWRSRLVRAVGRWRPSGDERGEVRRAVGGEEKSLQSLLISGSENNLAPKFKPALNFLQVVG